ncbi:hypothetical protein ACWC4D_26245 [Streptomyces sp. NPDC001288]
MKTTKKRALCSAATGVAVLVGGFAIVPATATSAAAAHCEPFTYSEVNKLAGSSHTSHEPVRGKVTKTAAKGVTVTDTMVVDSHKRGYAQPLVESHDFSIDKWRQGGDCKRYYVNRPAADRGRPHEKSGCAAKNSAAHPDFSFKEPVAQ